MSTLAYTGQGWLIVQFCCYPAAYIRNTEKSDIVTGPFDCWDLIGRWVTVLCRFVWYGRLTRYSRTQEYTVSHQRNRLGTGTPMAYGTAAAGRKMGVTVGLCAVTGTRSKMSDTDRTTISSQTDLRRVYFDIGFHQYGKLYSDFSKPISCRHPSYFLSKHYCVFH